VQNSNVMSKKLSNQVSIEELLNSIKDGNLKEDDYSFANDNILEFLSFYNIKPGTNKVPTSVLYKIFKSWTKSNNYGPKYFAISLRQYFEFDDRYALIDIRSIDLTKKARDMFFNRTSSGVKVNRTYRSKKTKQQIDDFLAQYGIARGKYIIVGKALYYIYERWAMDSKRKVINPRIFVEMLKFYLEWYKEYKNSKTYFYIDKTQLRVNEEILEKAKTWAKNYKN
jgi:hypothetical protein